MNSEQTGVFSRRFFPFLVTGFSSGIPLLMLLHQLPAWLTDQGVSLKLLAGFAVLRLPYSFKYLWAPLLDNTNPLKLGRRKSWMILSQLMLILSIPFMAWLSSTATYHYTLLWGKPQMISQLILMGLWIAFWGATQDIVLDAYRQEVLEPEEVGRATGLHVGAYRMAVLIPGSLALILKDRFGWTWQSTFYITAAALLPGLILSLCIKEPESRQETRSLQKMVLEPFREFIQRWGWADAAFVMLFIMTYKVGDALASQLLTPFYRWLGYSFTEIAIAAKQAMLWGGVTGSFLAAWWMGRISLVRALWVFGLAQTLAISALFALSIWKIVLGVNPSLPWLICALMFDAVGMALGTAALTTLLSRLTHRDYTATQFALLSSTVTLPQAFINVYADRWVAAWGWSGFYILCMGLSLPALLMVIVFRRRFDRYSVGTSNV
jgi:MFS transporter, PAT family, beta-lactamase induction signal transducer AmpG